MTKIYLFFAFSILIIFLSLALPREVTAYGCVYPECSDDGFCDTANCEPNSCSDCFSPIDTPTPTPPCGDPCSSGSGYRCTGGGGNGVCANNACVGEPFVCVNGNCVSTNPSGECTTACGTGCHACDNPPCGNWSWKTPGYDGYCCGYGADLCPGDACVGVPYRCVGGVWELATDPGSGSSGECTTSCGNCRGPGPTPTPGATPTPTPIPLTDCINPVKTDILTFVPMEGPRIQVTFPGTDCTKPLGSLSPPGGNCIQTPADLRPDGFSCDQDPNFDYGEWVEKTWQVDFKVEDLESVFAKYTGDDMEGDYQNPSLTHQKANLFGLSSSQWNNYNGPAQKLTPKIIFNQEFNALSGLKIKYVDYARDPDKATRQDVKYTYTDIWGNGPALTVKQMYDRFGRPNPPTASSSLAEQQLWLNTWGRYWDKIPFAPNDKAWGEMGIAAAGIYDDVGVLPDSIPKRASDKICPAFFPYKIIVPEYFRTNLAAAELNQLLLPKIAQSPLSYDSSNDSSNNDLAEKNEHENMPCQQNSNPPLISSPFKDVTLLASTQTDFPATGGQIYSSGEHEINGQVLAALDEAHGACMLPSGDPGGGQKYCMPNRIFVNSNRLGQSEPRRDRLFVCAQKDCPGGDPGICTTTTIGQISSACVAGEASRGSYACSCTDPLDPLTCSWTKTGSTYDAGCCSLTPGTTRTEIPTAITLRVPYLESIWNKSTSNQDNKKSGFWGFFAPPINNTGVLLNQVPYERHGLTPNLKYTLLRASSAAYLPPVAPQAYPDFISGVRNATDWVRNVLWPF